MQITEQTYSPQTHLCISLALGISGRNECKCKIRVVRLKIATFLHAEIRKNYSACVKIIFTNRFQQFTIWQEKLLVYILQQILIMLTWKWGEIISWQMSHCHNVNVSSHLSSCSHSSMTWQWITLRQEIILNITQHTAYFKHRTMHLQSLHVHKCVHVSSDLTCKLESLSVKHKIYIDKFYQRTKRT